MTNPTQSDSTKDQFSSKCSAELVEQLIDNKILELNQPKSSLPALFISHGAPTLALANNATTHALAKTGQNLPKPQAIIIMSAHWVSKTLEISNNPSPATWHDFSGFNQELNQLEYPAAGYPELAESLSTQLNSFGLKTNLNPLRPLDHGVWVPLMHLYPDADIPVVQLSLPHYFDAYACYQLGNLFNKLRDQQILIIGSGNITHNLSTIKWDSKAEDKSAKSFKTWLLRQLKTNIPDALDWKKFPNAEAVHPTPEHLLPLFFALGCGQRVSVIHESMTHYSLGMDFYRFD